MFPQILGVVHECLRIGGTVAGAEAIDQFVLSPEAETDAKPIIGVVFVGGGVEAVEEFFEVERVAGFGEDSGGRIVGGLGTAEGLGT